MTVSTTQTKVIYQGDGSTRHWAYTFPIMAEEHIALYVTNPEGQTQRIQSGYQVNSREKIVVYPVQGAPLKGGEKIALMRKTTLTQELDLVDNGGFFPENIEKSFDRSVLVEQELLEQLERAVKMPETASGNIDFTYEIIEARNRAEQAAGKSENLHNQVEIFANSAKNEANKSAEKALEASREADRAKEAADAAVTGGIRSINGIIGNDILLTPEDIQASRADHSHDLLEKIPEIILENSGKSLIINPDGSGCDWQMISGVPVGTIIAWAGLTPPAGYLECAGQILKREIYKDLFKAIGTVWGNTGADNFKLPDFTSAARFLRSRGDGLEVGMTQEDAIRNIEGKITNVPHGAQYGLGYAGAFSDGGAVTYGNAAGGGSCHIVNFDASKAPNVNVSDENRPKNAVVMYCIKAVDEYVNPAQVDMAKVDQEKANRDEIQGLAGTRLWISDEYQPVLNTPTIVEHGLNIDPMRCKCDVLLKCVGAEHGYSVGELVLCTSRMSNTWLIDFPLIPILRDKSIEVRTGRFITIISNLITVENAVTANLDKWRYIFRIWY